MSYQTEPTPIEELPVPREKACESCYPHRHGGGLEWCSHFGVYFCEPCIRHATAGCRVCTGEAVVEEGAVESS